MKQQKKKYSGVIVPLVTPITASGNIDKPALNRLMELNIKYNCSPFVLGSTGEGSSLSSEQKCEVVEYALSVNNNREFFYAGISGNCFSEIVKTGNQFFSMGADAAVVHLPSYYQLLPDQMQRFFETLADKLKGPLVIYNIKATTNMSIPLEVLETLSHHQNIAALKDSEKDDERLNRQLSLWKDRNDFAFLVGWAARSAYSLKLGADGIVPSSGNLVPGLYNELYTAVLTGNMSKADELQRITDEISAIYQKNKVLSQAIPGLKVMLHSAGICEPFSLPPCYDLPVDEVERIVICMRDLHLTYL